MKNTNNIKKEIPEKLLIIIILMVLVTIIDNAFGVFNNKTNEKKEVKPSVLIIYNDNADGNLFYIKKDDESKNDELDTKVGEYECKNDKCKYYDVVKDYALFYDNNYYLYNFVTNELTLLNLGRDGLEKMKLILMGEDIEGIIIENKNKSAFYSVKESKFLINYEYKNISIGNESAFKKGFILAEGIDDKNYVIRLNDNNVMLESKDSINIITKGDIIYYLTTNTFNQNNIYNSSFKLLFDGKYYSKYAIDPSGDILIVDANNKIQRYNSSGVLLKSSKNYKNINLITENHFIVTDTDNYIKIIDYNIKLITRIVRVSDLLKFKSDMTLETKEGINLYFANKNNDCERYYYNFNTKKIEIKHFGAC